jgi:DNA-directed RNA polymerase
VTLIETQIELEKEMLAHGIERYRKQVDTAEEAGRASGTSYASRLLPQLCLDLADAIEDFKSVTRVRANRANVRTLLRDLDSNQIAFITLRTIFDTLIKGEALTSTASLIGMKIEDEMRFNKFQGEHEAYYNRIIDQFKERNTVAYRHMHRVLTAQARKKDDGWNSWTAKEKLIVGTTLIELCITSTGLIEKKTIMKSKKRLNILAPNDTLMEWIQEHMQQMEVMFPDFMPCVIPPNDWVAQGEGGYHTPELQRRVEFIKIKDKHHRKAIKGHNYDMAMQAVSAMQRTAWKINEDVHDVMKEVWHRSLGIGMPQSEPHAIPETPYPGRDVSTFNEDEQLNFTAWKRQAAMTYSLNKDRIAKSISLMRTMQMANRYRDFKEFFYVYNCDFRGRVYASTSGLSPQGDDVAKGLLTFANGKPIGEHGGRHLAIHGANTYGEDKLSYEGRVEWVYRNDTLIRKCAIDPFDSDCRSFWANADKPYQFLAFCFEWAGYRDSGESGLFVSHLPIAADGTCNGIQNFSAMLRDRIGGGATNLVPAALPSDIYQSVADVLTDKLEQGSFDGVHGEYVKGWLSIGISRKLTKKPVMTLPYGSTLSSAVDSIEDYLVQNVGIVDWEGRYRRDACMFLGKLMWQSIGEVVIAAREAMDWIQKAARVTAKHNVPMIWTTPTGFKVYQGTRKTEAVRVMTQLCGKIQLTLAEATEEMDMYRQANGSAPNFVHSMDASHMTTCLVYASALGMTDFHMIHDSFGTYAADMDEFHKCIRESFVDLYAEKDVLGTFKAQLETGRPFVLADTPSMGKLDINSVIDSEYFFG